MDVASFEEILGLVSPIISRQNTHMRESIPAGERLALTLRFLATAALIIVNIQISYLFSPHRRGDICKPAIHLQDTTSNNWEDYT